MAEKEFLIEENKEKRVVCGYTKDDMGNILITTGIPKIINNKTIFVEQQVLSYELYQDQVINNKKLTR